MTRILLAVSSQFDEPGLVQAAAAVGLNVVRRCVDAIDLSAASQLEPEVPIVCSLGLTRLHRSQLVQMAQHGRPIIGLTLHDEQAAELRAWGIQQWVSAQGRAETTMRHVAELLGSQQPTGVWEVAPVPEPKVGTVIDVTGPHGAPGRTTVAADLAQYLRNQQVCAIDADLDAPSWAFRLGVIDDVSGMTLALRHLEHGTLNSRALRQVMAQCPQGYPLITGVADREYRSMIDRQRLASVIDLAKSHFRWVVVDSGPGLGTGDVHILVVRAEPLSLMRTVEILLEDPKNPALIAVVGGRRECARVRVALRDHGCESDVVPARARAVMSAVNHLMESHHGEGSTTTLSPTLDHL
jgi:Mrp family chromosome partitioning ATPase